MKIQKPQHATPLQKALERRAKAHSLFASFALASTTTTATTTTRNVCPGIAAKRPSEDHPVVAPAMPADKAATLAIYRATVAAAAAAAAAAAPPTP